MIGDAQPQLAQFAVTAQDFFCVQKQKAAAASVFSVMGENLVQGTTDNIKGKLFAHLNTGAEDFGFIEKPVWPAIDASSFDQVKFRFTNSKFEKLLPEQRLFSPTLLLYNAAGALVDAADLETVHNVFLFSNRHNWECETTIDFSRLRRREVAFVLCGIRTTRLKNVMEVEDGLLTAETEVRFGQASVSRFQIIKRDLIGYFDIIKEEKTP